MTENKNVFRASVVTAVENSSDLILLKESLPFFNYREQEYFTEQNIFYKLQIIGPNGRQFSHNEIGIGELYKTRRNYVFKREYCFQYEVEESVKKIPTGGTPPEIKIDDKNKLFLSYCPPTSFVQSLASEHSVLCSTTQFTPCPVELQNKTLLGRLDGKIQSIDKSELREILTDEQIIDAVSKNKKTLTVNTKNIAVKDANGRISTPFIHLKDHGDAKPQAGYLRYNRKQKCFEGFDGKQWKALKWEDDNENT